MCFSREGPSYRDPAQYNSLGNELRVFLDNFRRWLRGCTEGVKSKRLQFPSEPGACCSTLSRMNAGYLSGEAGRCSPLGVIGNGLRAFSAQSQGILADGRHNRDVVRCQQRRATSCRVSDEYHNTVWSSSNWNILICYKALFCVYVSSLELSPATPYNSFKGLRDVTNAGPCELANVGCVM